MPEFPHLPFPERLHALRKTKKAPRIANSKSLENLKKRDEHGKLLAQMVSALEESWEKNIALRKENGLPDLPDPNIIPLYLQVDPDVFDIESLKGFGIEIITEEEDGYVIGSTTDNFTSLKKKIDVFLKETGKSKDQAAKLWQIVLGDQWRIEKILSPELLKKWPTITDEQEFYLDIGIACYTYIPEEISQKEGESETKFQKRKTKWLKRWEKNFRLRDDLSIERQGKISEFVIAYGGEIIDNEFVEFDDSFCCRIRLSGKGLRDLVLNFQYLFEVTEYDSLSGSNPLTESEQTLQLELIAPTNESPKICIIDSGINEGHRLLNSAIIAADSKSYLPTDASTADAVQNGGHGTRVAGAVLFGNNIPRNGRFQLISFLQNARILDGTNSLPPQLFPPALHGRNPNRLSDNGFF